MNEKTFPEKLKELRAKVGMSQQAVADRTLVPKRSLEKWETGERTPPSYVQRFILNELENISAEK